MSEPQSATVEPGSGPFPARLQAERDALLDRLAAELDRDARVRVAWLGGSLGRGTGDDWSDLDVGCVVRDDQFAGWLDDLGSLYRRVGAPVLVGALRELHGGGAGRSQSVLYTGPISLDLDVLPESRATRPVDARIMLDRIDLPVALPSLPVEPEWHRQTDEALGFFWAMTPIALKYIGRGATARAVTQIDLLADTFVRLWRLTHQPDRLGAGGANWLHPTEDARLIQRLPRMGAVIGPDQALDTVGSLMRQVAMLHPTIEDRGVTIPIEAVREVESFVKAVSEFSIRHHKAASNVE